MHHSVDKNYERENRLILICARTVIAEQLRVEARELLRGDVDWPYLVQTAAKHDVSALVSHTLRTHFASLTPRSVQQDLRAHFYANSLYNQELTRELLRIQRAFTAENILAVPFKGAVLAISAYGDLALRQFNDLDFFLAPGDVVPAKDLLRDLGYQPRRERTVREEAHLLRNHWEMKFERGDGQVTVELQWRITSRFFSFPISLDQLQPHLREIELPGARVPDFPAEVSLLILCVHGARHGWRKLNWICDVAEFLRRQPELDWQWLRQEASFLGVKRILQLGLGLSHTLLDAPPTPGLPQSAAANRLFEKFVTDVRQALFNPAQQHEGELGKSITRFKKSLFRMQLRERFSDRARFFSGFLHRLFTPNRRDWALIELPATLSFVYYLLRPARLIGRYAHHLTQRLKNT